MNTNRKPMRRKCIFLVHLGNSGNETGEGIAVACNTPVNWATAVPENLFPTYSK